jgi:hypothetical protein
MFGSVTAQSFCRGSASALALLGRRALVTKDVPNYTLAAGVPATPLRRRFPPESEAGLMALFWWDWSHERLRAALPDFRKQPAADFIARYR